MTAIHLQDPQGRPLKPLRRPSVARQWVRLGYARVVQHEPYTLRLIHPAPPFSSAREYVLWRDQYQCQDPACDRRDPHLTLHHRVPRAAGGADSAANLLTLCWTCHQRQHQTSVLNAPRPPARTLREAGAGYGCQAVFNTVAP